MTGGAFHLIDPVRVIASRNCHAKRDVGARIGIMLHFDDSSTDESAVEWFDDPRCKVSYNRLYLDDGAVVQITPSMEHAAWHAGVCRTKNANRAFYGLAAATNAKTPVTAPQFESIAIDAAALFRLNRWDPAEVTTRIIGHEDEACFPDGRLGRKVDPTGLRAAQPILSTMKIRHRVLELLDAA